MEANSILTTTVQFGQVGVELSHVVLLFITAHVVTHMYASILSIEKESKKAATLALLATITDVAFASVVLLRTWKMKGLLFESALALTGAIALMVLKVIHVQMA